MELKIRRDLPIGRSANAASRGPLEVHRRDFFILSFQ
jgi:hypothetical protein